ncbi:hypothetical protein HIM_12325 [Hirsutella minnesotensis 3608]|uniref:Uncharacterized protein n=1 Tax=Hirsutella minnesotensis 3608 TaxID=1043627 RepID=A0A0F7ZI61_9HYPO|nr:hypothetical protein HIM_12325 [Hirsutella minnesotensis 3608]
MAAEEGMREMDSRRKETKVAARALDTLRKRATPKERASAHEAIRIATLNIYERCKIVNFDDLYFCGTQHAQKVRGDVRPTRPTLATTTNVVTIPSYREVALRTATKLLTLWARAASDRWLNEGAGWGCDPGGAAGEKIDLVVKPTSKARETPPQVGDSTQKTKRNAGSANRLTADDMAINNAIERRRLSSGTSVNKGRAMLQLALDLLGESSKEIKWLK